MNRDGMKLDLTKADKTYYSAPRHPQLVTISRLRYLTIADRGAPDGPVYREAADALHKLAYSVKELHRAIGRDYAVAKLEALRQAAGGRDAVEVSQDAWQWKLLLRMPDYVNPISVDHARQAAMARHKKPACIRRVRFEELEEGMAVQMLHIGPCSTEPETLRAMHAFMAAQGLKQHGLHHEIYLSDPRKTDPEAMKTILRLPVRSIAPPKPLISGTAEPV